VSCKHFFILSARLQRAFKRISSRGLTGCEWYFRRYQSGGTTEGCLVGGRVETGGRGNHTETTWYAG